MLKEEQPWWIYLVRMANGNLYCGVTIDIERRFQEHCSNGPKAAKALRNKGPLELVFTYQLASKTQAMRLEYRLKQWSKTRKEQLVADNNVVSLLLAELTDGK